MVTSISRSIYGQLCSFCNDKRDAVILALIVFLGFLLYRGSLPADFQYDDYPSIVDNPFIKHLNIAVIWSFDPSRFLTNLTFALNYWVGGLKVFWWHMINVLIHAVNAFLVFRLTMVTFQAPRLQKYFTPTNRFPIALGTAIFFLVHPIQTQSVIYMVQRSTLLAALFCFATVYAYAQGNLTHKKGYYVKAALYSFLGMFTKPLFMIVPIILLMYDLSFFGLQKKFDKKRIITAALWTLPLWVIPVLMGQDRLVALASEGLQAVSLAGRLFNQPQAILIYLRLLVFPAYQNFDYDLTLAKSMGDPTVLLPLAALALAVIYAVLARRDQPWLLFSLGWFFIALSPVILFPLPDHIFEHWIYLSTYGFFLSVCIILNKLCRKGWWYTLAVILIGAGLSVLTYHRSCVWKDAIVLLQDVVAKSPLKARAHNNLGLAYYRKGMTAEAKEQYRIAITLNPNDFNAKNNLAFMDYEKGSLAQAKVMFEQLIQQAPFYVESYINLANVYVRLGGYDQALKYFDQARQMAPNHSAIYTGLGNAYQEMHEFPQAKTEFQKAIWLKPESALAYYNLGNVYFKEGNFYEALFNYHHALRIQPDLAEAHHNMGNIYYYFGDYTGAIERYKLAAQYDPAMAEAYFNLANAYYEVNEPESADHAIQQALLLYEQEGRADKVAMIKKALSGAQERKRLPDER